MYKGIYQCQHRNSYNNSIEDTNTIATQQSFEHMKISYLPTKQPKSQSQIVPQRIVPKNTRYPPPILPFAIYSLSGKRLTISKNDGRNYLYNLTWHIINSA